jgi:hypothetical protein
MSMCSRPVVPAALLDQAQDGRIESLVFAQPAPVRGIVADPGAALDPFDRQNEPAVGAGQGCRHGAVITPRLRRAGRCRSAPLLALSARRQTPDAFETRHRDFPAPLASCKISLWAQRRAARPVPRPSGFFGGSVVNREQQGARATCGSCHPRRAQPWARARCEAYRISTA